MSHRAHRNNHSRQVQIRLWSLLIILSLLLAPILILTSTPDVQSAEAAETNNASIWLDGPNQATPGETISYDIKSDAAGLYGIQLEMSFDPTVLQAVGSQLTLGNCPTPICARANARWRPHPPFP